jgi:hypothetical protein
MAMVVGLEIPVATCVSENPVGTDSSARGSNFSHAGGRYDCDMNTLSAVTAVEGKPKRRTRITLDTRWRPICKGLSQAVGSRRRRF